MVKTAECLKKVQADTFGMFLNAWFFHWNVEGTDFKQLHALFGDIYNELFEGIDDIAEHLRAMDVYAPGSYSRFKELSTVPEEQKIPTAATMVQKLLATNAIVIASLRECVKDAQEEELEEIVNFIGGRLEAHTKHGWMLRATTKNTRD